MGSRIDNSEVLVEFMERLFIGDNPDVMKNETQEYLATVNPAYLNIAEENLKITGFKIDDITNMCSALNEMIEKEVDRKILFKHLLVNLNPGHAIHMLISDHDKILDFLYLLEILNLDIQHMNNFSDNGKKIKIVARIADLFVDTEYHYLCEENILFPKLEKSNVNGLLKVMLTEHNLMRLYSKRLKELMGHIGDIMFRDFKKTAE